MSDDLIKEEDWLRKDYVWRNDVAQAAYAIRHWATNINAVPAHDINRNRIESYYREFDAACEDIRRLLQNDPN
jgi:hypothetical protein